jgi:hypothetical protein
MQTTREKRWRLCKQFAVNEIFPLDQKHRLERGIVKQMRSAI